MTKLLKNLMEGESVVFTTRLHLIHVTGAMAGALLFVIGAIILLLTGVPIAAMAMLLGMVICLLIAWIKIYFSTFAVTNRRLIIQQGVLTSISSEMLLSKVESMIVEVGMWGRIWGYGTVTVKGTGGSSEVFPGVKDPEGFRRAALEQIDTTK